MRIKQRIIRRRRVGDNGVEDQEENDYLNAKWEISLRIGRQLRISEKQELGERESIKREKESRWTLGKQVEMAQNADCGCHWRRMDRQEVQAGAEAGAGSLARQSGRERVWIEGKSGLVEKGQDRITKGRKREVIERFWEVTTWIWACLSLPEPARAAKREGGSN
jgi:hypothetical protein